MENLDLRHFSRGVHFYPIFARKTPFKIGPQGNLLLGVDLETPISSPNRPFCAQAGFQARLWPIWHTFREKCVFALFLHCTTLYTCDFEGNLNSRGARVTFQTPVFIRKILPDT